MAGLAHQAFCAAVVTVCLGATAGVAQLPGAIDVKACGAKGDGVTDDTLAFRAAIAAALRGSAARNQGALIEIPCGKYILTARLTVRLTANAAIGLRGQTQSCTELQWNVAGAAWISSTRSNRSPARRAIRPVLPHLAPKTLGRVRPSMCLAELGRHSDRKHGRGEDLLQRPDLAEPGVPAGRL